MSQFTAMHNLMLVLTDLVRILVPIHAVALKPLNAQAKSHISSDLGHCMKEDAIIANRT